MYELVEAQNFLLIFLVSFSICAALIVAKPRHLHRTTRANDRAAVQSAHHSPTPRIGGLGIIAALVIALGISARGDMHGPMMLFSISLLPVFLAGLAEDLGLDISPKGRLIAAAMSSVIAVSALHVWIPRSDVPGLDALLTVAPFAVMVTILWGAGLCHAFNLIDGLNGLAASAGILTSLGLAAIAMQAGDSVLAITALCVVPAIAGFLALNWPFGKIFLGDAGAYSIGHVLGWLGVIVLVRIETVSVFAVALVFFWPVAETFFTIYRRLRSGRRPDQPDRLHYHQLIMRALEIGLVGRRRNISNPLATVLMLPLMAMPVLAGAVLWNQPRLAVVAMALFAAAYIITYLIGVNYACKHARTARRTLTLPGATCRAHASATKPVAATRVSNPTGTGWNGIMGPSAAAWCAPIVPTAAKSKAHLVNREPQHSR